MLEPSSENPLNIEAYSLYMTQPAAFDNFAQNSLRGGWINNVHFPNVCISNVEMNAALQINSAIGKRDASSLQSYAPIQIPTPSKRTRMQIEEDDEADSDSTHSSSQQYSSRETSLNSAKRGRVTPFFEDSNPQNIFVACSKLSLHQSSDPFPKILTSNGGVAPAIPHDGSSQVAMSFSP